MSMMMKLINAAAGQVQGDLIYFITGSGSSSQLARLSSVNVDSGEVRHGANFAGTGVYSNAGTDFSTGNPIGAPNYFGTWGYSATTMAVGDDGYIYCIGQTQLSNTYSNTGPYTDFFMRFNPSTLDPDPGFFYNMLNQVSGGQSSGASMSTDFCFHPPSGSVVVAGGTTNYANGAIVASQVVKIDPWPSTPVDAQASGYYHSSTNPNGRIYGSISTGDAVDVAVKNTGPSGVSSTVITYRARVETNGSDVIALGTWSPPNTAGTDSALYFKRAINFRPTGSSTTTTNAQRPSPDPFTAMTGEEFPRDGLGANVSWKKDSTGSSQDGIVNLFYRPGNPTNNTPGQIFVMTPQNGGRNLFQVPEDGHKPTRFNHGVGDTTIPNGGEMTLLAGEKYGGILITRYLGYAAGIQNELDRNGTNFPDFTNTHSDAGVQIIDLDTREKKWYQGRHTGIVPYANVGQQGTLSANTTCEFLPLSNNPNNEHLTQFVQTKNGRVFGITEYEDETTISPHGGFRIHELFIGDRDPNDYYRRSISWGNSVIVSGRINGGTGVWPPSVGSSNACTGNLSLNSKTFNDINALGKTRWLDQGHSYMQDVPTDTIYLRENTTIYAINPNTRTNITSEDFANQGVHAHHTGHSLIDPSANVNVQGVSGGSTVNQEDFFPSITFSEGANITIDNPGTSSERGYDRVGDTTFDMIYGDDSRVYLALKATVYNGARTLNSCHTLIRFHTGKDGTELVAGVSGPHPHEINGMKTWNNSSNPTAYDRPQHREQYYYGLFTAHDNCEYGPNSSVTNYGQYHSNTFAAGHTGNWSEVNLVYDNKRDNVICVGRRDFNSGDSYRGTTSTGPTDNAAFSRVVAIPVNTGSTVNGLNDWGSGWPGTLDSIGTNNYMPRLAQDPKVGASYGSSGEWTTQQGRIYTRLTEWCNSDTSNNPSGYERGGFLAGEVRNVTINGKPTTLHMDREHPTLPNRGSQMYFSGMSIDGDTQPYSGNQYQGHGGWPYGENRIGAMPPLSNPNGGASPEVNIGFGNINMNHNTSNVGTNNTTLYHAKIRLKTTQTVAVNSDNNEEGIRCIWYYKGAFHGVTTYNEGTYVYMPEPEHDTANDNYNTVPHYVSQCESGQNSYNNVIGGQNTKIGTAEGCRNADWAACLAPGGILCIPKQDSGYNNAGFLTINLGTRQIINTNGNPPPLLGGEPFVAPSSLNPNGRQIKQMIVTSTGKIWAILDYEDPSASTLQFRILQVVFNSNYSSVTWSGGLYTSQASNANSGHVKFYRTVCGNMPQSKMEWDAV